MSLADGFEFPAPEIELWLPLRFDPAAPAVSNFSMRSVARLAPGSTAVDAKRELDTLLLRLPETYSDELVNAQMMRDAEMTTTVRPLKADIVGDVGSVLWILLGAVGFVLLVACANVANLFLVRAESREREIAVRCALGAGRAGLTRLFLADGLVVAAIGGVAGLAVAWLAVRALTSTNAVAIPRIEEVGIDAAMIVFCGGVSLLAAIVCAAYPMWRYSGRHAYAGLRGGRGDTATRKRLYARNALVVAQVTMALMLLVGSGLMARSFWGLATVDPGFVDDNVLTMRLSPVGPAYETQLQVTALYDAVLAGIATLPGVDTVGAVDHLPMAHDGNRSTIWFEDFPTPENELPDVFLQRFATPGYFESVGIPIIRGRVFEARDHGERIPVAIISQAVADRLWAERNPVGRRVRRGPGGSWYEIVGVAGDIRNGGLGATPEEMIYFAIDGPTDSDYSYLQDSYVLTIRGDSSADAIALLPAVREMISGVDATLPLTSIQPLEIVVSASVSRISFAMAVLAIAAAMTLLLGAIGLHGVVSYVVGQRTREIGVRMALGARGGEVARMVVQQDLLLTVAGVAIGLLGAAVLTRFLGALLYEVSPLDPVAFVVTSLTLLGVSFLASYLPARRASSVDPAIALRAE